MNPVGERVQNEVESLDVEEGIRMHWTLSCYWGRMEWSILMLGRGLGVEEVAEGREMGGER